MINEKNIVFATTTFKRLNYFKKMVESLKMVTDFNLVDDFYILDDGSDKEDLSEMLKVVPTAKIITSGYGCQPKNLNAIFNIECDYLLLVEDDVIFTKPNNYIRKAFDVLYNSKYTQFIYSCFYMHHPWEDDEPREFIFNPDKELKERHESGTGLGPFNGNPENWPNFFLISSMIDMKKLKSMNEKFIDENHFERNFGYRITKKGFKSISSPICCEHIGELSTYGTFVNRSK